MEYLTCPIIYMEVDVKRLVYRAEVVAVQNQFLATGWKNGALNRKGAKRLMA